MKTPMKKPTKTKSKTDADPFVIDIPQGMVERMNEDTGILRKQFDQIKGSIEDPTTWKDPEMRDFLKTFGRLNGA